MVSVPRTRARPWNPSDPDDADADADDGPAAVPSRDTADAARVGGAPADHSGAERDGELPGGDHEPDPERPRRE